MRVSDEMQKLTDHLREAHKARVGAVTAIRNEAVQGLAELHAARREMGAALREQLHAAERARRAEVASMLKELASDMAGAHEVWAGFARRVRPTPAEVTAAPIPRAARRGRFLPRRRSPE